MDFAFRSDCFNGRNFVHSPWRTSSASIALPSIRRFRIRAYRSLVSSRMLRASMAIRTYLRVDNGPEFIAGALEQVVGRPLCQAALYPTGGNRRRNAFIESFNSRVSRRTSSNRTAFGTIFEASDASEIWRQTLQRRTSPQLARRSYSRGVSRTLTKLPNRHRNRWPRDGTISHERATRAYHIFRKPAARGPLCGH